MVEAKSKADLAEAGRKKLEAFRNRKKNKKEKKSKKKDVKTTKIEALQGVTPAAGDDSREDRVVSERRLEEVDKVEATRLREPSPLEVESAAVARQRKSGSTSTSGTDKLESGDTRAGARHGGESGGAGAAATASSEGKSKAVSLSQSYSMLSDSYMSSVVQSTSNNRNTTKSVTSGLFSAGASEREAKPRANPREAHPVPPKLGVPETQPIVAQEFAKAAELQAPGGEREGLSGGAKAGFSSERTLEESKPASARGGLQGIGAGLTKAVSLGGNGNEEGVAPGGLDGGVPTAAEEQEGEGVAKKSPSLTERDVEGFQGHIDLLAREKYELQRGLEAQQRAIEALTKENMSLTESFNAKGSHSRDLESQVVELQEQIDTFAMAAERALEERDAALNGSAASAERTKSLASEVIQLEENLLQARSNELKAQRENAPLQEKVDDLKHKVESLQKEREALVRSIKSPGGGANGVVEHHAFANGHSSKTDSFPAGGPTTGLQASVAHSEAEVVSLVEQLERATGQHTAATVRSIFSLLDDLL
ncbi:hypothetical protein HOP50_05g38690 [Chloropicon primus]|uniref:Uncharacterized protein n=2 Tax=Chloropicon primus TaxID=1764295 RepID=A0A5B8ML41_9CHLO|nr:hypothetical protein A3770_05p38560 [Chloropicon primus]UPR00554.1 hypothetical protein HOP50_05g38690 [Chloropicon primus]|eukprot:QDZ21338.1 hypothetical protein A3770_05p38560 [Chloropicon primus]